MQTRHKNSLLFQISVFGISFGANLVFVVLSSLFLLDILNDPFFGFIEKNYDKNPTLRSIYLLSWVTNFGIPTFLSIYHSYPIYLALWQGKITDLAQRRLLNTPLIQASIGLIGYSLGFFSNILAILVYDKANLNWQTFLSFLLINFIAFFFTSGIVYYSLEFIIRKKYIPILFPDNKLANTKGVIPISIHSRFFLVYAGTGLFPMFVFTKILLGQLSLTKLDLLSTTITVVFLFLVCSSLLVVFFTSSSYQTPITQMRDATVKIRQEIYDVQIPVRAADEIGYLAESINEMAKELQEKEFIKDTFGKIVDPSVRDYLLRGNISLGGELEEASILFCDLRDFTTLSENHSPELVVELLNQYFEKMSECISREGGMVNKYIGDAIMAIFNVPIKLELHCDHALNAAIAMRQELEKLNQTFVEQGFPKIANGIGLHTGKVIAGNIGSKSRMEYTVMGDTVNATSRIEGLCKSYQIPLLFSKTFYENLKTPQGTYIGKSNVKGKKQSIELYGLTI
ncbi:MAG: adenylate/guanylate cyclase domain-containing protein [Spirochaetota bacterium]